MEEYEPYIDLAIAIIVQAADDYRKALWQLKRNPKYYPALTKKSEIERFFYSAWFGVLTDADPDYILTRLRRECV
ncbi:MAG: hypothetical protein U0M73_03795 [Christensenellales bacterium]|jgi:hypothetical protein